MSFNLKDVVRFSNDVMVTIPGLMKVPVQDHNHWQSHVDELKRCKKNYEENPTNMALLHVYAMALANAANYLIKKDKSGTKPTPERLQFIDDHTNFIYNKVKPTIPTLTLPVMEAKPDLSKMSPIEKLGEGIKAQNARGNDKLTTLKDKFLGFVGAVKEVVVEEINPKSLEVQIFLASDEYKNFVNYRDFLQKDQRSHTFFGTNLDLHIQKYEIMNRLITNLNNQTDMKGIQTILKEFADGKHKEVSKDEGKTYSKSDYEVLNTGQNITTYVLSALGLKNTTSIDRFISLMKKADTISAEPAQVSENRPQH